MNVALGGRACRVRTVTFDAPANAVHLIEQRLLPHQFKIVALANYRQTAEAIRSMVVRGAGAIGATAAYGLAQGAREFGRPAAQTFNSAGSSVSRVRGGSKHRFDVPTDWEIRSTAVLEARALKDAEEDARLPHFRRHVQQVFDTLASARPTAVDPVNAMRQVLGAMETGTSVAEQQDLALAAAEEFANEDVQHCDAIGRHGARLIRSGMNVLTHCNAGWLAFVDIGSATAPLYAAQAQGRKFHVFCDETRPRSQGATLTAWELAQQGISHQIIADNAAGHLMQRGKIDLVIVGSDRTLGRTGEVANKIGTYTKAVLAHRHKIPFYVAIPLSTIDWNLQRGRDIPIEERHEREVLGAWGVVEEGSTSRPRRRSNSTPVYVRVANPTSGACNPGFDVTPPELITGIITPEGIFKPRELWKQRARLGFRRPQ